MSQVSLTMYRRLATTLLLSGIVLAAGAAPALAHAELAHAELIASTPAEGASLAAAPNQVELTFNEPVTLRENPLEVVGPGNVTWQLGTPRVAGAVVSVPVTPSGPAGQYTLAYHVVSDDGDAVSGSVTFTLTTGATSAAAPAEPSAEQNAEQPTTGPSRTDPVAGDGDTLLWVWLAAGAILLAAVVFVTLRVRRSGR